MITWTQNGSFQDRKNFIVDMESYLNVVFKEGKGIQIMQWYATTPASDHLLKTRADAEKLSVEAVELFHHLVAKLLDGQARVPRCDSGYSIPIHNWKKLA